MWLARQGGSSNPKGGAGHRGSPGEVTPVEALHDGDPVAAED
jgi:hypothetical protein